MVPLAYIVRDRVPDRVVGELVRANSPVLQAGLGVLMVKGIRPEPIRVQDGLLGAVVMHRTLPEDVVRVHSSDSPQLFVSFPTHGAGEDVPALFEVPGWGIYAPPDNCC